MALLRSVDDVPGVDLYEYRDTLYYNTYDYRLRLSVPGARYTWWCKNPQELDDKLSGNFRRYGTIRKDDKQDVIDNLSALKEIITLTQERKKHKKFSMRIEGDCLAVFANDLTTIDEIKSRIGAHYTLDCTQAQTGGFSGVKYFTKEPKHKYRVYLRSKRVSDTFHIELREMLDRLKTLHPSNALRQWMTRDPKRYGIWYFRWASSAHFIDYDDESTLSYLALMHGDVLGKKYKLEKRLDPV